MENKKKWRNANCRKDCPGRVAVKSSDDNEKSSKRRNRWKKQKQGKRRKYFVYKPEEEIWYEPYMRPLMIQFSKKSPQCDSNIEFPWKDIAVIVEEKKMEDGKVDDSRSMQEKDLSKLTKIESTGLIKLPWEKLVINEILDIQEGKINRKPNDFSSSGIPWNDLTLEGNLKIKPLPKIESCSHDNVEIPWDAILVPNNIIIQPKKKKKYIKAKILSQRHHEEFGNRFCHVSCSKQYK